MFAKGKGISQNPAEAARWHRMAANQGWRGGGGGADAQFRLGAIQ